MARRRNTILDAINSFNAAYDTTTKVGKDIELSRIAQARPEEMQGFTTEDSDQLRAAADSGQYDIGIKTKEDGTFDSYTVTPKADPAQTGNIAMRGVTDFMGKRTAGSMSDDQVDRARQTAMAGVLEKYDPQEGMRMRREIKSQERDDERWGQQQKQWGREEEERNREVQYRTEREQLLQSSPMGQAQAATAQYEQQLAAYNDAIKAGKTPQEIGLPPQKPNIQRPGPMQTLAGYADLIAHDYKYGKLNTDGLIQFQEKMQKAEQENYTKALTVAQSGGTPEQIAKAFNTAGMQIDPKNVSVTRTKQANGPDQVVLNYKDEKGQTATINVLSELEGYGKAKEVFDRFYQGETNRRGNEQLQLSKNADGRAGAQFAQGQADRAQGRSDAAAKAEAAVALFKERNPNASEAELNAVRRGILEPVPTADKNAPSEVKLAKAMVDAGLAPDMGTALERAMSTKSKSARDAYLEMMKPSSNGIVPNEAKVAAVMEAAYGHNWRDSASGAKAQDKPKSIASDPRAISIRDDKSLSVEQKRQKLKELGYQ